MPQTNIAYDTPYNRQLSSLLQEMDEKHWRKAGTAYHPSILGYKMSNFHGDYAGEPSAKMMVGGGSHGDQKMVHSGNSPAYPPYMMSSGMLVNSGGARIGVDGAVGGKYSMGDFGHDVAGVVKEVAPDLIRAYLKKGSGRKKGGSKVGDQIASVAKTLAPFAPLLLGLGRPAPKSKADVVDALKSIGAKKSHSLKKLKELAMSGGYSFNDFVGDVAHVGREVAPDIIRAYVGRGKKSAKKGGINLKDVLDSSMPVARQVADFVKSADPSVADGVRKLSSKVSSKAVSAVKSAVGAGRGRSARTAIVKKVMSDKGLSMIEASKYVKAHKLY